MSRLSGLTHGVVALVVASLKPWLQRRSVLLSANVPMKGTAPSNHLALLGINGLVLVHPVVVY